MANGKVRVNVNAVYKNGQLLFKDMLVPARILLAKIPKAPKYSEVAIRLVISDRIAEDLYDSIGTAEHIEISIEGSTPPAELDNETRT